MHGGIIYYDGQFDDARLAITLAQTAAGLGATLLNYAPVTALIKRQGLVRGVVARDAETGRDFEVAARVVLNATGVFADAVRKFDEPEAGPLLSPSQGVHIVLPKSFLPGDSAIMVPKTDDGRVLFAIPWHDRALIGTTDTPVTHASLEPRPLAEEIEFLLTHAARYLSKDPRREDVLSVFAGLRPLRKIGGASDTASVPRDHSVLVSKSGLLTVVGGKWTTYRKMGEDAVNQAAMVGGLEERPCRTGGLRLHGWQQPTGPWHHLQCFGTDADAIRNLAASRPELNAPLHPRLPYTGAEVVWATRHEMARTVEDVLSRRTRMLLLDARASVDSAPLVARLMAAELGRNEAWQSEQLEAFGRLAKEYLLAS